MFLPLVSLGRPVRCLLAIAYASGLAGVAGTGVRNASGKDECASSHSKLMFRGHGSLLGFSYPMARASGAALYAQPFQRAQVPLSFDRKNMNNFFLTVHG
ncbi:MAG TPA: hypothetical protein VII35_02310 [Steroidobacteraceae bacterium]